MAHYRITPLEKKSIEVFYELYKEGPAMGLTYWANIRETFRWGQAFIDKDFAVNLPGPNDKQAYCKMDAGESESCEFEDSISVSFEFDEALPEEERKAIEKAYFDGGAGWIYDGDHEWEIEDDYVIVYGPFKVELCNEDGSEVTEVNLEKESQ